MNGLNRSPAASSNERPGGLAQASHAAASMVAMDGTTRAVKLEDMGGQAVRSGGIAHLSTHGAVFVVKGLKPRVRRGSCRAATQAHTGISGLVAHRRPESRLKKRWHSGSSGSGELSLSSRPRLQLVFLRSTITPKSPDFVFPSETSKPSAAKPRRNNSRTAAARLGM